MFGLGMGEMAVIAILILVVFGGKKLPQLGAGLAKGIQNFKKGLKEVDHCDHPQEDSGEGRGDSSLQDKGQ
ncbi:MAG: twin-arginine translocase TatA/TatE family subunit [Bacteriovoracales bacterium]|nr:twin-arginine translocase TatA/TatE family subunit [Bacteriovoracales bacterium]